MSFADLLQRIVDQGLPEAGEFRSPPPDITGFYVRWCRALLNWKISTLASVADVSVSTVERVERGEHVGPDQIERIGLGLGLPEGYLTAPRKALSADEAADRFEAEMHGKVYVPVRPLSTQPQIRDLGLCQAFVPMRGQLEAEHDAMVDELLEALDFIGFMSSPQLSGDVPRRSSWRREQYRYALDIVERLRGSGVIAVAGSMPLEGVRLGALSLAGMRAGVLGFTLRRLDPAGMKRRFIIVDRVNLVLTPLGG